ncbi:MAG: TIGR00730 family Rossman fold protein [Akkermansiaceae bacterium]|nr:TIGR00730 family Rossman fold protein [Akkermansiaceae bacterium]
MHHSPYLDKRDFSGGNDSLWTFKVPVSTGIAALDAVLYGIAREYAGNKDPKVLRELLSTAILAARADISPHDLDVMNRTLAEMLEADTMFSPYRHVRKICVFGSARIAEEEPAYGTARAFGRLAAENGYMVITGGGPGIMQAANEGAGAERSFGLNITLPYEQQANPVVAATERLVNFYYFYVRKLNFVKESDALVACPGGFGTMDELFESVTLMQTGKATIYPIVLLDSPGRTFWANWSRFIREELLDSGLISPSDMNFLFMTKSPEEAIAHINRFYSRFHSYRYSGEKIVLRLLEPLSENALRCLEREFAPLIKEGGMEITAALPEEANEPLIADLPRLVFTINRGDYGMLRRLIDAVNNV